MARLLEIREICELALRQIGAFAIRSSGARPEEMQEARYWLDMIVGHVAARQRAWWLVPDTGQFALTPGQASYDLTHALLASDGVQFPIEAFLFDTAVGRDVHEIKLLRREEWEAIEDKARLGEPVSAYIDRTNTPKVTLYPVPQTGKSYLLRVTFQSFGSDMTKNQPIDRTYRMRRSWNLYLVTALAARIGNGPVRKLPADEVKDMQDEAKQLLFDLEAYDAHEQANEPRRVGYYDGV